MADNLDRYIPEFDENEVRERLSGLDRGELLEMLIYSYKEKRVWAKVADEGEKKLSRIREICNEPSALLQNPGIPGDDDLRKLME